MPGIPVYGPIDDPGGASYILPTLDAFYPGFLDQPLGFRYADTRPFVKGNEFDVWSVQAPLAQLFAILLGPDMP